MLFEANYTKIRKFISHKSFILKKRHIWYYIKDVLYKKFISKKDIFGHVVVMVVKVVQFDKADGIT